MVGVGGARVLSMDRRSADLAVGRVADCQSALQPVPNRRYTRDLQPGSGPNACLKKCGGYKQDTRYAVTARERERDVTTAVDLTRALALTG